MGAIYGVIGDADLVQVSQMGERLKHRGKLTQHWKIGESAYLGESIHDSIKKQISVGDFTLIADADINNAGVLRAELKELGHQFSSDRDDEVILLGFVEWGIDVCKRLKGDFAFAIWDNKAKKLILCRDPFGSRPIFYCKQNNEFAFASEYKALLCLPSIEPVPDFESIQNLQYTKYPPTNRTLLKNIYSTPAGHHFEYMQGKEISVKRFWDLKIELRDRSLPDHILAVRKQFLDTIDRQVGNRNVIGATLSGGVDSAAIVAAIRKVRPNIELHTFTCGYGQDDPEIRMAAIVAEQIDTIHHPVFVTPKDLPRLMPEVVWHLEDPIARSETILNYETARYAAEYVDFVVAGHACDGLYGGMPRHKIVKMIEWLPFFKTPFEEFYHYTQASVMPRSLAGKILRQAYFRGRCSESLDVIGNFLQPAPKAIPTGRKEILNEVLRRGVVDGLSKWLPKVDRLHLGHGLKYCSPFTDIDLVENAFQIPDHYKIYRGKDKHVFREAVSPLLPPIVKNRPKFPQAMNYNSELTSILDKLCTGLLGKEHVQTRGFFDWEDIKRIQKRKKNQAYSSEQSMRIWTAIMTEFWAQTFLDKQGEMIRQ